MTGLCSCNYYDKPESKGPNNIEMPKKQDNVFTGRFVATFNNSEIIVEIIENQNEISGTFFLNNETFQVNGTSSENKFSGKITEEATGRFYNVSAEMKEKVLHLSIPFPELNNQIVELQLNKETASAKVTPKLNNQKEKNAKLIGTWRYTEVLNSGYGSSYASLATDYYVQFNANGECISWSGSSSGGSQDVTLEGKGSRNTTVEEWYTQGQNLIFINPKTKQKVSITFFAEENRMMLKGKKSRVYQRIRR